MSGLDANKVIPSDADTPAEDEDAVQPAVTMDNLDNATFKEISRRCCDHLNLKIKR